jgi:hypothetical protein
MARRSVIDNHPKKQEIIEALTANIESLGKISQRYGVGVSVLSKYRSHKLVPHVEKKEKREEVERAEYIYDTIGEIMGKLKKMLAACDEYLADPVNGQKYYLGPHDSDLRVVYDYVSNGRRVQKSEELRSLIGRMEPELDINVIQVNYKYADPRRLILHTADSVNKQLDLLARLQGQIRTVNVTINNPVLVQIREILLDVVKEYPEIGKRISDRITSIVADSAEPITASPGE